MWPRWVKEKNTAKNKKVESTSSSKHPKMIDINCYRCGIKFKSEKERYDHEKNNHGEEFHCFQCGFKFKSEKYRYEHIERRHVRDVRQRCKKCNERFNSQSLLNRHLLQIHNLNQYYENIKSAGGNYHRGNGRYGGYYGEYERSYNHNQARRYQGNGRGGGWF